MAWAARNQPDAVECELLTAEAKPLAVTADPYDGPDHQWWAAPTSGGGRYDIVVQVDEDGHTAGGGAGGSGCNPTPPADIEWSGGGGNGPPNPAVSHGGHVNIEATRVVLTFPDQAPVRLPLDADGYFLKVFPEDPSGAFSYPERIDALDSNDNIVATITP